MSFTIKELEALSGIKAHTIRIWEQRYHFLKPLRTQTNIRRYSNEELKTLLTVALLNKYGYKISRIDGMSHEERTTAVLELPGNEAAHERLVNKMIGIFLLPVLVVMAFAGPLLFQVVMTLAFFVLVILFIYRFIISYNPIRNEIKLNRFHFFIYLCAFEIAPLLLIYKVLYIFVERVY